MDTNQVLGLTHAEYRITDNLFHIFTVLDNGDLLFSKRVIYNTVICEEKLHLLEAMREFNDNRCESYYNIFIFPLVSYGLTYAQYVTLLNTKTDVTNNANRSTNTTSVRTTVG